MQEIDFKTFINGVSNDLKIAIDDVIGAISGIQEDVEKLKIKTSKPDRRIAQALLEYIAMDDGKAKENMEIVCGNEIKQYFKWLDSYCEKNGLTQEQALNHIIDGKI